VFHSYVVPLNVFAFIVCLPKFFESTVEWERPSIMQSGENGSFMVIYWDFFCFLSADFDIRKVIYVSKHANGAGFIIQDVENNLEK